MARIRIGVGGWVYEPWRGSFFPPGLPQREELAYASRHLTSIEINGTYYGSQKPASFARWHAETPDDFVFAVKGPRFATNRKLLAEAGPSIERFFTGGVMELRDKLGPVNWQFMATKRFDPEDFAAFLALLPRAVDGRPIRHAVEVRHPSFRTPEFVALARGAGVAVILGADSHFPEIADVTAPFVYVRIMGTREEEAAGYPPAELAAWAARARRWAAGAAPDDLETVAEPAEPAARDVFLYVISGAKHRNPAAAMALIDRIAG
ncbi:DUF72 domain-containing protein [Amaricoccus sp.]|uniref:DUF72 domain-containing protein n=1 Tax=Amaricoccus sp. TaxID=1872485 RepID=UPI002632D28F|nr:DUF72 domain-containing protein [Amaricoccus sp.]HRO10194.1 DUF72 domain-containing protein [Amaricoccus sp.]